jgi:U11/U12 small nuclear ribonucleoprotein SNRNP48
MMQELRDYKRRRQRYRARNTHLTKRRPVEVARDIIQARMRELFPELDHEAGEVVATEHR